MVSLFTRGADKYTKNTRKKRKKSTTTTALRTMTISITKWIAIVINIGKKITRNIVPTKKNFKTIDKKYTKYSNKIKLTQRLLFTNKNERKIMPITINGKISLTMPIRLGMPIIKYKLIPNSLKSNSGNFCCLEKGYKTTIDNDT